MKAGKRHSPPDRRRSWLHGKILRWYKTSARSLPWRRTRNPYKILLSEIMLQQTQVARVREKYTPFLRQFPSFEILAKSSPGSVILAWRGMGYNNRAVRLGTLARIVISDYNGKLPADIEALRRLPGIGKYTAHAIACFAFGRRVPVVDTNISRVLKRLHPRTAADVWDIAERALPTRFAYEWNQALMELGATVCTSTRPRCADCPINSFCPSAFKPVRRVMTGAKKEPGRNGVPNRIYRGRIVEALRTKRRAGAGLDTIGKRIKPDYSLRDRVWLLKVLAGLERDGLIEKSGNGSGISVKLAS